MVPPCSEAPKTGVWLWCRSLATAAFNVLAHVIGKIFHSGHSVFPVHGFDQVMREVAVLDARTFPGFLFRAAGGQHRSARSQFEGAKRAAEAGHTVRRLVVHGLRLPDGRAAVAGIDEDRQALRRNIAIQVFHKIHHLVGTGVELFGRLEFGVVGDDVADPQGVHGLGGPVGAHIDHHQVRGLHALAQPADAFANAAHGGLLIHQHTDVFRFEAAELRILETGGEIVRILGGEVQSRNGRVLKLLDADDERPLIVYRARHGAIRMSQAIVHLERVDGAPERIGAVGARLRQRIFRHVGGADLLLQQRAVIPKVAAGGAGARAQFQVPPEHLQLRRGE